MSTATEQPPAKPDIYARYAATGELPPTIRKHEFARLMQISKATVSAWVNKGLLNTTPTGRIKASEARRHGL